MKSLASTLVMLLTVLFIAPLDGLAADKQQFCNDYATKAVEQYNLGKQYNLPGIVPPAWSNDRAGHYNWCIAVPEDMAKSENAKRQAYLDQHLPKILSAKKVPKVGSAVKNNGSDVAATPISIPHPIKVKTQKVVIPDAGYVTVRDIEKAALISLNKNMLKVRLHYRVESSVADKLYAGAFLYDADMQAINAGYKPTREQSSPEGDVEVTLVLPEEPFHAETIEVFLIHSRKVIVKKYFKFPLTWDGTKGRIAPSTAKASSGFAGNQKMQPTAPKLSGGWGKQAIPISNGIPIGLDPGRGP